MPVAGATADVTVIISVTVAVVVVVVSDIVEVSEDVVPVALAAEVTEPLALCEVN